jgi:hypothetical protein
MEKTAVEWLAEKMLYIDNEYDMKLITKSEYHAKRRDIIEEAKEMELNQMLKHTEKYVFGESLEKHCKILIELLNNYNNKNNEKRNSSRMD